LIAVRPSAKDFSAF